MTGVDAFGCCRCVPAPQCRNVNVRLGPKRLFNQFRDLGAQFAEQPFPVGRGETELGGALADPIGHQALHGLAHGVFAPAAWIFR